MAFTFLEKRPFDDLEIITLDDDKKIYMTKGWLYTVSDYFKSLLTNGLSESNSSTIKLTYRSKILDILFGCIYFAYHGNDHIKRECLKKLDSVDDVYDFLSACEEYQLVVIKNLADRYFSPDSQLFSFYSTKLITAIHLFNMQAMKIGLYRNLQYKKICIASLDFNEMSCETLNFFKHLGWEYFIEAFVLWTKIHDPSDEELKKAGFLLINYKKTPTNLVELLTRSVRNFKKAEIFKHRVLEDLTYVLFPNPILKQMNKK